jgi:hypothetical protein
MTINEITTKMMSMYEQSRSPQGFLRGFFRTDLESFHNSREVAYDVQRFDEDIAVPVADVSAGYHEHSADDFNTKEFKVPAYKDAFPVKAIDQLNRFPGNDPFQDPNFVASAIASATKGFRKITNMIKRSVELQASQILQTGTVTLIDRENNTVYVVDFKPKATHFPTAVTAWDGVGPNIAGDLSSLASVIRDDGLEEPLITIWDEDSYEVALADDDFKSRFELRRADLGFIAPMRENLDGGQYRGTVEIGTHKLDVWTYGARYKHPVTGTKTKFIQRKKVIMMAPGADFHATFGSIPRIVPPDTRVLPFLPQALGGVNEGILLTPNAWISPDNETVWVGAGTRPLLLPRAIDQFGCLDTDLS